MTERELQQIEASLGIRLPSAYRVAMLSLPVPALAGNSDTVLWDDASALIKLNETLRAGAPGGVPPWPQHMFAMGDGGDSSPYAIDLRSAEGAVWWVDHSHLDGAGSGEVDESLKVWLASKFADLRHDCDADGLDSESPAISAATPGGRRVPIFGLLLMALVAALVLARLMSLA